MSWCYNIIRITDSLAAFRMPDTSAYCMVKPSESEAEYWSTSTKQHPDRQNLEILLSRLDLHTDKRISYRIDDNHLYPLMAIWTCSKSKIDLIMRPHYKLQFHPPSTGAQFINLVLSRLSLPWKSASSSFPSLPPDCALGQTYKRRTTVLHCTKQFSWSVSLLLMLSKLTGITWRSLGIWAVPDWPAYRNGRLSSEHSWHATKRITKHILY